MEVLVYHRHTPSKYQSDAVVTMGDIASVSTHLQAHNRSLRFGLVRRKIHRLLGDAYRENDMVGGGRIPWECWCIVVVPLSGVQEQWRRSRLSGLLDRCCRW